MKAIHRVVPMKQCCWRSRQSQWCVQIGKLGGCPFNGPLSVMKYPIRESPHRDAASPIKYNGLHVRPAAVSNLLSPIVI